jgi:putative PIN family toxin of toxin-antitoxin system
LIRAEIVVDELRDVLRRRFKLPPAAINDIVDLLHDQEVVPRPGAAPAISVRDPDDAGILASAIDGRPDVLVTGDRDLLDIADAAPLSILSPRGFWELASKTKS